MVIDFHLALIENATIKKKKSQIHGAWVLQPPPQGFSLALALAWLEILNGGHGLERALAQVFPVH